jgi:hypothetical protein
VRKRVEIDIHEFGELEVEPLAGGTVHQGAQPDVLLGKRIKPLQHSLLPQQLCAQHIVLAPQGLGALEKPNTPRSADQPSDQVLGRLDGVIGQAKARHVLAALIQAISTMASRYSIRRL